MYGPVIRRIALPAGEKIPVLGLGTWHMAEVREHRKAEIGALRLGLELGMTLIDTAEMYAEGETERLVGDAISGRRDEVFLISKVLPSHATHRGTIDACAASLRRLKTDRLDMYLLHWRGSVPLWQTIEAFVELKERGWIRHWGVSNDITRPGRAGLCAPAAAGLRDSQVGFYRPRTREFRSRRDQAQPPGPDRTGPGVPAAAQVPSPRNPLNSMTPIPVPPSRYGTGR